MINSYLVQLPLEREKEPKIKRPLSWTELNDSEGKRWDGGRERNRRDSHEKALQCQMTEIRRKTDIPGDDNHDFYYDDEQVNSW